MIEPIKLVYANFLTKDSESMLYYYTNIMGLSLVEEDEYKRKYLSCHTDHHNIILTPSYINELLSIGFLITDKLSLNDLELKLKKKKIPYLRKSDALAGVPDMIELNDPDGYKVQLFSSITNRNYSFKKSGIVPFKLGHVALGSLKVKESVNFYQQILNFHFTDRIGNRAHFLTCNQDHHVINISNIGYATMHHIAFELKDASHQYFSHDLLAKFDIPILWGPSRHTAGHNIASYHHDPNLNLVELFIDMDIFNSVLRSFEPRPWHENIPQKPGVWKDNAAWGTQYKTSILELALKKFYSR